VNQAWLSHYPKGVKPRIEIPEGQSIVDLVDDACNRFEFREALSCMGSGLTYRQFNRRAMHFGSYLANFAGVCKGDRVAIMLPNIMQFPIAFLGVLKVGGVAVNTNPLYTAREMKQQFKDSGAKVLVVLDMILDKVEEVIHDTGIETVVVTSIGDQLPFVKDLVVSAVMRYKKMIPRNNLKVVRFKDALKSGAGMPFSNIPCHQDDLAVLQYTGGTTGRSKGAMLTHRSILANIYQVREWAQPVVVEGDETVLTALPLYHIFSLSVNFLTFLTMGAKMVLVPKPVPISNTVKVFKSERITVMTGVNTLFAALNNDAEFRELASMDLKFALAGAMALQQKVSREFQTITGIKIIEGFGLTEASPVTHCNPIRMPSPPGSIGLPLPSTEAMIVSETGHEVPTGEVGELVIRGPQVMRGYWNAPEESSTALRDGWLWTGDMARVDEQGFFFIVDRKKDMILVSGFNVYPNEVEDVLALHPKVSEVAVIGEPDDEKGEVVKAFIVARGDGVTEEELRKHCEKQLTGYKRPSVYEFRETLPKSPVGKILRRELRTPVVVERNL
jgi:long-chain acyl-CoA synthetase